MTRKFTTLNLTSSVVALVLTTLACLPVIVHAADEKSAAQKDAEYSAWAAKMKEKNKGNLVKDDKEAANKAAVANEAARQERLKQIMNGSYGQKPAAQ